MQGTRTPSLPGEYRTPLATIRISDSELEQRSIKLRPIDADWEEPGPIEGSGLAIPAGDVWLIRYVGHPELGLEVRAADPASDDDSIVRSVLEHLDLGGDRVIWAAHAIARPPGAGG